MDRITLFGLVVSIGGLIFIIELVRRGKLREDYSLLWLGTGVIMVMLIVSRPLVDELARWLGVVTYPPAALFVVAIIFMLFILLQYSTALTRLSRDNKKIAQEMALLRQELTATKAELAQSVVGEQAGGDQHNQHGTEIE
jgi:hypothetical protein